MDITIHTRLKEILVPLNLRTDFLNRILNSAQETIARVLLMDALLQFEHIHVLVLAPLNRTSNNQIWGFFSVERLGEIKEGVVTNDHTIEIYLYGEGGNIPTPGNE